MQIKPALALLTLVLAALLAAPAARLAYAASGSASPTEAAPGTRVHFNASGFTPGERIDLWASPPGGGTRPRYPSVSADTSGAAVWSWDVAAGDPNGAWTMSARGVDSDTLLAIPFTVVGSTAAPAPITVAPSSGAPGTTFAFTASGLTPTKAVDAWLVEPGGASRDLVPGEWPGLFADADGNVAWSWTAPADAAGGTWTMVARDSFTRRELTIAFTITAPPGPAPVRSVSPASGAPGTTFTVTANGFTPGERVGSWLVTPAGQSVDSPAPFLIADGKGAVTWRWTSPANAQAGTWQAVSSGRDSRVEVAIPFAVGGANPAPGGPAAPTGTVNPASGAPGSTFTFTVTGFDRTEKVAYWPTQPDGTVESTTRRVPVGADGDGRVTLKWQAPERAQGGTWTMTFRGQNSSREARVTFTVAAAAAGTATVSPASGAPGTTFTFRAEGFNVIERLDTWLERPDGVRVAGPTGARADRDGRVEWTWTAPADAIGGQWTMVAQGQDSDRIERIAFTITDGAAPPAPPAGVSPERGPAGTTFTFTAAGFAEGERVGYWLNRPDGTIERFDRELHADKDGRITWTYTVPANAQGGTYLMAARSSQSDAINNDVSVAIQFVVE